MHTRRDVLAGVTTLGSAVLAGCSGDTGGGDDAGGDDASGDAETGTRTTPSEDGTDRTTTTDANADSDLETHPGTAGLDGQPTLGLDPTEATGVVVAFEDPSCPTCARWERQTFPTLQSKLVDGGDVAFVFRGYPVIKPWGEPATKALEATYDRDAGVFWRLRAHYFANQGAFDAETVLSKTEAFLADTAVDGAAVVAAVRNGDADAAVNVDLSAGRAANVRGTPGFLLFRDGSFRTKVIGAQGYDVFATALGG
ncbi:MAG: DsbA family protein [Haloarculaceae archaeon]